MANFTWRSLIVPVLSASACLITTAPTAQACCLFGGWGDCCGGGYSGFYRGYSSYYGGYGPSYGYGAAYGYGPSYGYGSSYAYGYGNASSGYGCSTCAGGGCETYSAPTNPTKPVPDESLGNPDDGYRPTNPGGRLRDREPRGREDVPVTPRRSKNPAEETPANGLPKKTLPAPPREDGLLDRGAKDPMDEANPDALDEKSFEPPVNRRGGSGTEVDPFGVKKPPMSNDEEKQPEEKSAPRVDDDSFPVNETDNSTKVEAKKPDLGPPSETEESAPADAAAVTGGQPNEHGEVIKPRPAPFDNIEPEEAEPELPKQFDEADDKPTSAGVSPKVRLVLRGKFGSPSIVRIKLRPNPDWQPLSAPPVLAKH